MINKEIKICPHDGKKIPKSKKCEKCEFYNPKKWYCKGVEIDVFCTFVMNDGEKKYLK